jgi:hypothetical protein
MMTLHCTRKLRDRLPATLRREHPDPEGRLVSWYANLLMTRPARLVLLVEEVSRLPVLLRARPLATLTRRIPDAVGEVLTALGVDPDVRDREHEAMRSVVVAPTASRSLLGTLNDFAFQLQCIREQTIELSLVDLSLALAETPVSPLRYDRPAAVTRRLLNQ